MSFTVWILQNSCNIIMQWWGHASKAWRPNEWESLQLQCSVWMQVWPTCRFMWFAWKLQFIFHAVTIWIYFNWWMKTLGILYSFRIYINVINSFLFLNLASKCLLSLHNQISYILKNATLWTLTCHFWVSFSYKHVVRILSSINFFVRLWNNVERLILSPTPSMLVW